jgi:hypothetical protein
MITLKEIMSMLKEIMITPMGIMITPMGIIRTSLLRLAMPLFRRRLLLQAIRPRHQLKNLHQNQPTVDSSYRSIATRGAGSDSCAFFCSSWDTHCF